MASPEEVIGRYRVLRRLGQGGMGMVDEVVHLDTGMRYALKRSTPQAIAEPELRLRFVREARALASLQHRHVVPVHAAELDGPAPYLVQPLLPGGSLADRLAKGPLPLDEARRVFGELVAGMAHAHERGVIHRDLKPDNVLFDEQGRAVVTDFGLTRLDDASSLTATGTVMGTPCYMAPEQARDAKAAGPRADVYGLGALLYAMLSGRAPFESTGTPLIATIMRLQSEPPPRLSTLRPDAPADLVAVCERALAKDPGARWADAVDLEEALRGRTTRRGWWWAGSAAALIALTCSLALLHRLATPERSARVPRLHEVPAAPPASVGAARSAAEPRPEPGPWRVTTLRRGRKPRACFDRDHVLVWTGEGLARCPRSVRDDFPPLQAIAGLAEVEGVSEAGFVASMAGTIYLGSVRPGGLRAWSQGRWTTVVTGQLRAAVQGERWLVALDQAEGGRVHVVDTSGAEPLVKLPCFDPHGALLRESEGELLVWGWGGARSVLRRFVREGGGWMEQGGGWMEPGAQPNEDSGIRCVDRHPSQELLAIGDDTGRMVEVQPDTGETVATYTGQGWGGNAHANSLRWLAYLGEGDELLSVSAAGQDSFEVVLWDARRRVRVDAWNLPGRAEACSRSSERDQVLISTPAAIYLVAR